MNSVSSSTAEDPIETVHAQSHAVEPTLKLTSRGLKVKFSKAMAMDGDGNEKT
jgi:hypothetical protein